MNVNQALGMAKQVLSKVSPKAAQALDNPQLVQKATQAFNGVTHDKNGMIQAVQAFGGEAMLNRAVSAVKKNPVIDFALRGFGVNVDNIKNEISKSTPAANYTAPTQGFNGAPSYRDRLSKLK